MSVLAYIRQTIIIAMKFILILTFSFLFIPFAAAENRDALDYMTKEEDLKIRHELQQKIDELTRDEQAKARLMKEALHRIRLCTACHGKDGNSVVERAPSLAGQNPVYLVDQFMRFADGRRNDFTMSSLSKVIKHEDKIKLAIYFSEQTMIPAGGGQTELIPHGKKQYQILCAECHGEDGRGAEQGYAHLAGQRPEYIVKMLKEFKNQTGKRSNPWMTARANGLDEKDRQGIAAYLAGLK
jgi:cytochrome c553